MPFSLGFVLAPELVGAQYGIAGWNVGTLLVARLFGAALLSLGAVAWAVRDTADFRTQAGIAMGFAVTSGVATAVSIQSVVAGAVNNLGWLTVATYGFFTAAWATIVFRRT